jgi:hypothetical protein
MQDFSSWMTNLTISCSADIISRVSLRFKKGVLQRVSSRWTPWVDGSSWQKRQRLRKQAGSNFTKRLTSLYGTVANPQWLG